MLCCLVAIFLLILVTIVLVLLIGHFVSVLLSIVVAQVLPFYLVGREGRVSIRAVPR